MDLSISSGGESGSVDSLAGMKVSRRMPSHRTVDPMEHDMHMQISRLNLFLYELGFFSWAISRSFWTEAMNSTTSRLPDQT